MLLLPSAALAADTNASSEEPTELLEVRQLGGQGAAPVGGGAGGAAEPAAATATTTTTAGDTKTATSIPDQWEEASPGTIGMGTLTGSPGATHTVQLRNEGTLGQTPWIGMAIGLTFTALAAVTFG